MRRSRVALVSAGIAATFALMLSASTAAGAASGAPRLTIEPRTSAIVLVDNSAAGTGPFLPAVSVLARFRNCPGPGFSSIYFENITLVQDGVSYEWLSGALGVGFFECTTVGQDVGAVGAELGGVGLHPGHAYVTFSITGNDTVVASDARRVNIPETKHG